MKLEGEPTIKRYGEFHCTAGAYSRGGGKEVEFLGAKEYSRQPKDDTYNIDNQTLYREEGTPEYERLMARATRAAKDTEAA